MDKGRGDGVIMLTGIEGICIVLGTFAAGALSSRIWSQRGLTRRERQEAARLRAAEAQGQHLCFSTVESLAYALEASDNDNAGHLDCVQRCALAMARVLSLSDEDTAALRSASLLHTIGRLGIPEHILRKAGALTAEEQEKLRTHPVLGARILAPIPFPWPVVPLVRHHAEHFDGKGYPDALKGSEIPLGARILAVANAYSALLRHRPYRAAFTPSGALAEIEARSGSQFDPAVVAAFRSVAAQIRTEEDADCLLPRTIPAKQDMRGALEDITSAQRETRGLYALAQALAGAQHLEAVADTLLLCVKEIVPCAACVLFLPEQEGEILRARAALGTNERHLLGSLARVGTYLTGRAFSRGEVIRASFLHDDLDLRNVSGVWTPFRSTLILPLMTAGQCLGTLNLYAEEPDAFTADNLRVLRLVATQAAHALGNALRFDEVRESAYTDALTGLRNGRYLREYLEREINRAGREESAIAVLNIDVDRFKQINDRLGHEMGDQVLKEIAEILHTYIRNYDLAARYAGDEFVVVLSRADRMAAEVVSVKLKHAVDRLAQKMMSREPDFPKISISIGIALFPEDGKDLQALLCRSDAAMYNDKQTRQAMRDAA